MIRVPSIYSFVIASSIFISRLATAVYAANSAGVALRIPRRISVADEPHRVRVRAIR